MPPLLLSVNQEASRLVSGSSVNQDQYTSPTVSVGYYDEIWTQPNGWNGPGDVLYKSFDNMTDLVFMEGDRKVNIVPRVRGKVGEVS